MEHVQKVYTYLHLHDNMLFILLQLLKRIERTHKETVNKQAILLNILVINYSLRYKIVYLLIIVTKFQYLYKLRI